MNLSSLLDLRFFPETLASGPLEDILLHISMADMLLHKYSTVFTIRRYHISMVIAAYGRLIR